MKGDTAPLSFILFAACAGVFIGVTGLGLPELVSSHFDAAGAPNGHMPRGVYLGIMIGLLIVVPTLLVFTTWGSLARPDARINLPNRDYWLAPARRAETIAALRRHVLGFGVLLILMECWAHWLVVRANRADPVHLASAPFVAGLIVFFALVGIGLLLLVRRFGLTR